MTDRKDGADLVRESKHFHEIIMSLRDDRDKRVKEIERLNQSLTAIQRKDMKSLSLALLTFEVRALTKRLRVKDVFTVNVMERYEIAALQEAEGKRAVQVDDLRERLASSVKTGNILGDLFDEIWDGVKKSRQRSRKRKQKLGTSKPKLG